MDNDEILNGKFIFKSKDLEEKCKDDPEVLAEIKHLCESEIKRMIYFTVIYNPSCDCPIDVFFRLNRFSMSEKIFHKCKVCGKYGISEISDLIISFFMILPTKEI